MAYVFSDSGLGWQPIATTQTTKAHALGTIRRAVDPTYGEGEFIYLKGVASTVVGSVVTYDPLNSTTTLSPNTANLGQPLAVAMSANVALGYGWYQIAGAAVIKKTGVVFTPSVRIFLSATTGRVRATLASGKQVANARTINAATISGLVSTITVLLQRPFAQGQVV